MTIPDPDKTSTQTTDESDPSPLTYDPPEEMPLPIVQEFIDILQTIKTQRYNPALAARIADLCIKNFNLGREYKAKIYILTTIIATLAGLAAGITVEKYVQRELAEKNAVIQKEAE